MGIISTMDQNTESLLEKVHKHPGIAAFDLVKEVTTREPYKWTEGLWKLEPGVKSQESGVKRKKSSLSGIPDSDLTTHNSHPIPILGIPACGMYADTTVFDLILPRILAGEKIGRKELAQLGHGGLCLKCETCRYPVCPFGK